MPDSTSPSAVFSPDLWLPPNTRMTVNLSHSLGPFPNYGSYAWSFRDVNREASSTLPHTPPFSWDSIPNSNKCGKSELISVFEDLDYSPTSIVMGEDDIQNLLISPTNFLISPTSPIGHTPLSTTSDTNDNGPSSLDSESDVREEPLTTSPQTPSLSVAHRERSSKFTQLSIDTTFKCLEVTLTLVSSLSFLDSPCWNPLIYDIPLDRSVDFSP